MANYSIRTTRKQEIGLKFSYDHQADQSVYPTQQDWFQFQIDTLVSNPMIRHEEAAQVKSFDESFKTIPELEQPAARSEIEASITAHGGSIVPPPSLVTPVPQPESIGMMPLPPGFIPPPPPGSSK